jgi:predicted O-methyltransferase YrrM
LYNRFQLAKKYLHYLLSATNGKGHGVHSPFVYDLIINVLNKKENEEAFRNIEKVRRDLLLDRRKISVLDLGAGSGTNKKRERSVRSIARASLKPPKYAGLLNRLASHNQSRCILELGTSLGITSSYLAAGNPMATVYTCEGAASVAGIARETFQKLGLTNIRLLEGDFGKTLSPLLQEVKNFDLAFIDGNHRKAPTLEYFSLLKQHSGPATVLVFDDIHWSAEMESAWVDIKKDPGVTLSIDLFQLGIVFFNTDINHKQEFTIRF